MPMFRKKPVVLEARKFSALDLDGGESVAEWCGGVIRGRKLPPEERVISIRTLEGEINASNGDWVIRGVRGEFYPCKPGIFAALYEAAE